MNFFSNNPFVKILGFGAIGLLIAKFVPVLFVAFIFLVIAGGIWFIILFKHKRYPFDLVASVLLGTTILLLSGLNFKLQHPTPPRVQSNKISMLATVLENPQEKSNSYQTVLKIIQTENDSLNGYKLIAWLQKDSCMQKIQAGDEIFAYTKIQQIENNGNPFEFDYKSYMAQQGIYFRCYISKRDIGLTETKSYGVRSWAENFREKLLLQLRSALSKHESFEVISALTLGYRKELSQETRESFTSTGAMHVLAVSGLHVGLIFLFLLQIFRFLNLVRGGKWIRLVVISLILWAYALITGFSPSVQRATTMFTFLLIAEIFNRKNSIYNSIAASAFMLLLINPDILFAVGFQLSYAAVISIVYFYPRLNKLAPIQNWILKKPWQLLCVSLAAQIGTFPLTLYYFNQFPVYFWLSNFIVIPAAFTLLFSTILFFFTSAFPPLNHLIAQLLDTTNSVLLHILRKISVLPGAIVENIIISKTELACLISIILLLTLFIHSRQKRYLQLSLLGILFFNCIGLKAKLDLFNQHRIINYKSHTSVCHLIDGRKNYILCKDTARISSLLYSNVITHLQLNPPIILPISDSIFYTNNDLIIQGDICQFGNKSIEFGSIKDDSR